MWLRELLEKLHRGEITVDEAERRLKLFALEEMEGIAILDLWRELRKGVPEIILGEGKTVDVLVKLVERVLKEKNSVIASRLNEEQRRALEELALKHGWEVRKSGRTYAIRRESRREDTGVVGVITAGTADVEVAEEARLVAEEMGCRVLTAYDVGIAGLHRLFPKLKEMVEAGVSAIVVAAGMEGALPSLVASLVDVVVIGVPTSVGYGAGGRGEAALHSMLQSCTPGLVVVNIDNGVGAGIAAALIAREAYRKSRRQLKKKRDRN